jgi:hypothetical protein
MSQREYLKNRLEFLAVCAANDVPYTRSRRIMQLAQRYQLICLMHLNEDVGDKFYTEQEQLEKVIAETCRAGGITGVLFNTDARGATVKLRFADGQSNSMGDAGAYCVPTNISALVARLATTQPPKVWS